MGGRVGAIGWVQSTGGGGDSIGAEGDCSAKLIGIGGGVWPLGSGGRIGMGGIADGASTSNSVCPVASSGSSIPSTDWKSRS